MQRRARWVAMAMLVGLCCARFASATPPYIVGGGMQDWGVDLDTSYGWFVQSSFTPSPLGNIDYVVEDYYRSDSYPDGGEVYDLEAAYFDDTAETFYFGIVTSLRWDASIRTYISVTANGVTINSGDFDEFAWASVGEYDGGRPNYFLEGSIQASRFGDVDCGETICLYAWESCGNDSIRLYADRDGCPPGQPPSSVPEPATCALLGLGLLGAIIRKKRS